MMGLVDLNWTKIVFDYQTKGLYGISEKLLWLKVGKIWESPMMKSNLAINRICH